MKSVKFLYLSIFLFSVFSFSVIFGYDSLLLHLQVMEMRESGPPEFYGNSLLLTYKGENPARYVAARFEHEDFGDLHLFLKNQYGVFFLIYPLPNSVNRLKYRINVDGLWMKDPRNTDFLQGEYEPDFSLISLYKDRNKDYVPSTKVLEEGIRFAFTSYPGRFVSLVGDFNNWDPYMNPLTETKPGCYETVLRVARGRHFYYYLVDGEKKLDPFIEDTVFDNEGNYFSVVNFPG